MKQESDDVHLFSGYPMDTKEILDSIKDEFVEDAYLYNTLKDNYDVNC